MNKTTAALLIAALATIGIATAGAGEGWHGLGEHQGSHCKDKHMGMVEQMTQHLGLTPDQQVQVRAIVDQAEPALNDLRGKMAENRKQLQTLTQTDTANESAIRALADEQGKLKAEMIVQRSHMQVEINKVLTPAQREQWKGMRPYDGMGHEHGHWEGERT